MGALSKIPLVQLTLMVVIVTAVAWITVPGAAAFMVSFAATGVLVIRGMAQNDERDEPDDNQ